MNSDFQLTLPAQTPETAAAPADAILKAAQAQLGFVPNMYSNMANAPGLLDTYRVGYEHLRQRSTLTAAEQEVVFLTISRFHGCDYCMAAHSMIGEAMSGTPQPVIQAIREDGDIEDPKLSALRQFVHTMVETRGLPTRPQVESFLAAGYGQTAILDVVLAIAVKTLSNFSNHLFHTDVDAAFAGHRWSVADGQGAA